MTDLPGIATALSDAAYWRDRAETAEADNAELDRAHELMAAQFRVMQQEKEHGWREAERMEASRDEFAEVILAYQARIANALEAVDGCRNLAHIKAALNGEDTS